jgi:hypothetical protein
MMKESTEHMYKSSYWTGKTKETADALAKLTGMNRDNSIVNHKSTKNQGSLIEQQCWIT